MAGAPNPQVVKQQQEEQRRAQELSAAAAPDQTVLSAMDQAAAEIEAEKTQQQQLTVENRSGLEAALAPVGEFTQSIATGAGNAIFQAKDALLGSPNYEDKSQFRKDIEKTSADLARRSSVNSVTDGVTRFLFGMAATPSGKVKALEGAGKGAKFGYEVLRGAAIGSTVFDPQQERLSDLVEQYPALHNPVTAYLSASPDDSDAEGRFKNALEGIGMDLALVGAFTLGVKAYRLARGGDTAGAQAASKQAEEALAQYQPQAAQDVAPGSMRERFAQGPSGGPTAAPDVVEGDLGAQFARGPQQPPSAPVAAADVQPGSMRERMAQGPQPVVRQGMPEGEVPKKSPAPAPLPDTTVEKIVGLADVARRYGDYGNPEEFRGVAPSGYINWTKVGGAADVQTYTQAVAKEIEPKLRKIAGDVVSDAKVNAMIQARAAAFGEDPAAVVAMIRQQGKNAKQMVADMEAGYAVASAIFQDVHRLASKIKIGLLDDFGGDREAAKVELARQMAIGAEVLGNARAMTANAGRSLRRMRNEFKVTPETVKRFEGNTDALVEALYHSKGDPKLMSRALAEPSWGQKAEDVFSHLVTNGPLWWWPTHVINGISNAYMLAARPTEKVLGSLFVGASGRAVRRQALKEYRATVAASRDGWEAAKDAWLAGDSIMVPHQGMAADAGNSGNAIPWVPVKDVTDLAHNALLFTKWRTATGLPTRFLGMVDELVKTMRYRAVVQARAAMDAEDIGLTGGAAESFIAQRLDDAFDEMGRGVDIGALREAQATTMQSPLRPKTLGFGIQNLVQNQPILRAIFTYVRTPINLLRYGVRMTPGLQYVQQEFREMLSSADPMIRAQARGQQMLGALWLAAVAPFVINGQVTGGGPRDPKLRAELVAQGWRPYSYVYEKEDGEMVYLPLGRLDPVALPLGMMADLWDLYQHPDTHGIKASDESLQQIDAGMQAVGLALMKNIMNKTYLMQLDATVKALSEPDKFAPRMIGNIAENTIPGSAALRGSNPDEYSREARTIVDNIIDTMPGLSKTLEPRYDALSEPVLVQRGLWSTSTRPGDKVRDELQRLILETGKSLTPADPKRESGVDLRDFKLADGRSAYSRLNEIIANPPNVPPLAEAMEKVISSEAYQKAPDGDGEAKGTKLWMLRSVVSKYREAAYKTLLRENPDLHKAVTENKRKAAAAYRLKQQEQTNSNSQVDQALTTIGVQ